MPPVAIEISLGSFAKSEVLKYESFLSRATVNHAAEVAGHYLQSRLSKRQDPLWKMPTDFYPNIYLEALGFFASKIVNHRRKAESLEEIRVRFRNAEWPEFPLAP